MNIHIIKVSLGNDGFLSVMPTFCEIEIDLNGPCRIFWILDGNLEDAEFTDHAWDAPDPSNVFGNLVRIGKKILSVKNNHTSSRSILDRECWLRVEFDKQPYETPKSSISSGFRGKHPVIINR